MNKIIVVCLVFLSGVGIFLLGQEYLMLPTDILFTFPQYQEEYGFHIPQNSLTSDPVVQFEPWRMYAKERLLNFELPFINDKSSLGSPFLANPQTAIFYPLSVLYLLFSPGPAIFYINLSKFICFLIFSYLYLKSISVSRNVAVFGAVFLSTSAFFVMWLAWPHTNVYLLFPLILFCIEKIRGGVSTNRYYVFLVCAFFVAVLGGHPETLFSVGSISLLYLVVRLWTEKKRLIMSIACILSGFLLSAFQLLPFLEYLLSSHMLFIRQTTEHGGSLPISGVLFFLFPFLLGGPHLFLYKPLSAQTNFQELLGGYTGITLLVLGIVSAWKIKKNSLSIFWILIAICTFCLSFGIFPFSILEQLPLMNISANQRLTSYFGFSLIVLGSLFLSDLIKNKNISVRPTTFNLLICSIIFFVGCSVLLLILPQVDLNLLKLYNGFPVFVIRHIGILLLSFALSTLFLLVFVLKKSNVYLLLAGCVICFQTITLFLGYNTIVSKNEYYPQTKLIRTLQSLSRGTYIEVGNNAIPENVNLAYGLSNVENYDALEIRELRKMFDDTFPHKNQWGNVDDVTYEGLRTFGIRYVISDYDIRDKKTEVFTENHSVLSQIFPHSPMIVSFSSSDAITGIRLLPATFNRNNTCTIQFQITSDLETIFSQKHSCSEFTNNHFFTLQTPDLVSQSKDYTLIISSEDSNDLNSISFFGGDTDPYLAILTSHAQTSRYELLAKGERWNLFEVMDTSFVSTKGHLEDVIVNPESISFIHTSQNDESVVIHRASYPGWGVSIDNTPVYLDDYPLLRVFVPRGRHYVSLQYTPWSFYVGGLISLFTGFGLLLFIYFRMIKNNRVLADFRKNISNQVRLVPWYKHVAIVGVSLSISIALLFVFLRTSDIEFRPKESTAINWITYHNYPKHQDYFGYVTVFPLLLFMTIIFWIAWICLKKRL